MWLTFNCGVGMVLVVPPSEAGDVISRLTEAGEHAFELGQIAPADSQAPFVERTA